MTKAPAWCVVEAPGEVTWDPSWTPCCTPVVDGDRVVLQVGVAQINEWGPFAWTASPTMPPQTSGQYLGPDGLVDDIADAAAITPGLWISGPWRWGGAPWAPPESGGVLVEKTAASAAGYVAPTPPEG